MGCFARLGTICTILKNVKNTHGGMLLLVEMQAACNVILHGCFLRFFKIVQMVPNCAEHHI